MSVKIYLQIQSQKSAVYPGNLKYKKKQMKSSAEHIIIYIYFVYVV